ncbi:MAG: START domain-containing protein [Pseudomonadota bacterium]
MTRPIGASAALALSLVAAQLSWADEMDWETKRDRDGIQVFTSAVAGSPYDAVRSTMTIASSLSALVALVLDTEACPEWADLCAESNVFETVSETEFYVYTLNDVPWPVSDRDATTHVVWTQDPETLEVTMTATLVTGKRPKRRRTVRLAEGTTGWSFQPLGNGEVRITSSAHLEPGGAVPGWLSNRLLVDSPFTTMQRMRDLITSGRYDDAQFDWVSEP